MDVRLQRPWSRMGVFDHQRLLEDLAHSADLFHPQSDGRPRLPPPTSLLTRLGQDVLHATPADHGAWALRKDPRLTAPFHTWIYGHAFQGRVAVSWLMAAVILGRVDLRPQFLDVWGQFCLDQGLRWFVLHGVREHAMWPLLTHACVADMRAGSPDMPSPLSQMVALERPDLPCVAQDTPDPSRGLVAWLQQEGCAAYGLDWLLTPDELARGELARGPQAPPRPPKDLLHLAHMASLHMQQAPKVYKPFSQIPPSDVATYQVPQLTGSWGWLLPRQGLINRTLILKFEDLPEGLQIHLTVVVDDVVVSAGVVTAQHHTLMIFLSDAHGPVVHDGLLVVLQSDTQALKGSHRMWVV